MSVAVDESATGRLKIERHGRVLLLTLNDPATRNVLLGDDLFSAFEDVTRRANTDLGIGAVVLTGADPAFSSGGDIRDMHEKTGMFRGAPHEIVEQYRNGIQRIPRALWDLDVPLIAAVNGPAIGAGCDLACVCDMRIASIHATFAENFIRVGIVSGAGGAWLLPRIVGYARAAEMAFTGEAIDAKHAFNIGLVAKVVPHEKLIESAVDLAQRIACNPPLVLRWTKRLLKEAQHERLDTVLSMAATYQALAHQTAEHADALAAMIEKRQLTNPEQSDEPR